MNVARWNYNQMKSYFDALQQSINGWQERAINGVPGAEEEYQDLMAAERAFFSKLEELSENGHRDAKAFLARHWSPDV